MAMSALEPQNWEGIDRDIWILGVVWPPKIAENVTF